MKYGKYENMEECIYLEPTVKLRKQNETAKTRRRNHLGLMVFKYLSYTFKNKDLHICILRVLIYDIETITLTHKTFLRVTKGLRLLEIKNVNIKRRIVVANVIEKVMELKWSLSGHIRKTAVEWPNCLVS